MVLLIALVLLLLTIWPKMRNIPLLADLQARYSNKHSKPLAGTVRNSARNHELYESLQQTSVAFIFAQNLLALAISIAALLVLNSPGALGTLDEVALGIASGSVILPTAFGLYMLTSFYPKSQSWYLFILSLLSSVSPLP